MLVSELQAMLAKLPPNMEVGVESSIGADKNDTDALEGHQITSGYVMDFTTPTGGQEVFLLQIDREEDSTGRWVADREPPQPPDKASDEAL